VVGIATEYVIVSGTDGVIVACCSIGALLSLDTCDVVIGNCWYIAELISAQRLHLSQSPSLHSGPERTVLIPGDVLTLQHWSRSWNWSWSN
jgi:hypothetical protein